MAYKDKDKQREVQRNWVRQKKATKGSTEQGSTLTGESVAVAIKAMSQVADKAERAKPKRGLDIKCFLDLPLDVQDTIQTLSESEAEYQKRTRIAIDYQHQFPDRYNCSGCCISTSERVVTGKPGDADYNGICTKEWRAERGKQRTTNSQGTKANGCNQSAGHGRGLALA